MTKSIATAALAAALLAQSQPALADANIKIGQLAIHPSYEVRGTYDDNIYLVPPNKNGHAVAGGGVRGSWIIANNLGLNLELPMGERHKFTGSYGFRSDRYQVQREANNAISQTVEAAYAFQGAVTRASLWDRFTNTQDPQFNPNSTVVAGELVARERRWENTAGAMGEYALGDKFFFSIDGQVTGNKYLNRTLGGNLNRSETLFGFKTGYKVQPKTRVYIAAHRAITHYSAGRAGNHKDWLADVGVEGRISPKVSGQIQTGLQYRRYDRDEENLTFDPANPLLNPTGGPKLNFTRITRNWMTGVRLNYKPTERDDFGLNFTRALNETPTNASGGGFYVTMGAGLDGSHAWDKLTFGANIGWQVDKYAESITLGGQSASRRDDLYMAGVKTEYRFTGWLSAGASYTHIRRHSVFTEQFNYKGNRTSVNLRITL